MDELIEEEGAGVSKEGGNNDDDIEVDESGFATEEEIDKAVDELMKEFDKDEKDKKEKGVRAHGWGIDLDDLDDSSIGVLHHRET